MSTNSLTELMAVLAEKALILESMRESLEEEQRCIIEARPEQLDKNTTRASELVSALDILNCRLRTLLLQSGKELGILEVDSLSSLFPAADHDSRLQLRALQKKCFSAAGAINCLIVMNEGLLRNSLDIIGRSISLFSRLLGGCETYGAAGRILYGKAQSGILCREI